MNSAGSSMVISDVPLSISKRAHIKDLSGSGARLFGGRWNHLEAPGLHRNRGHWPRGVSYTSLPNHPAT
jgi:hypothetical protein